MAAFISTHCFNYYDLSTTKSYKWHLHVWDNQQIWDDLKKDRTKVWTPEEVLSYIEEPYFTPGNGYRYSNTNYLLLAMIIEKATGSKLSTEFRERFWQNLGIENTYLSLEENIPDNQAHVYGDNFNNDGTNIDLTFLPRAFP